MRRWRLIAFGVAVLVAGGTAALTAPGCVPGGRGDPRIALEAPIGPALRVPLGVALLAAEGPTPLRRGDHILGVALDHAEGFYYPRHRADLWRLAAGLNPGDELHLEIARGNTTFETSVPVVRASVASRLFGNWPLLLVAAAFLLFGLLVLACSHHPVAAPVFAVTASSGVLLGSLLEPALPWAFDAAWAREIWSRIGLLAFAALPASLLHLAMRFPVVPERFGTPGLASLPYLGWLAPAAFGQARLYDARAVYSYEWLCAGAALLSVVVVVLANRMHRKRMSAIERFRSRSLVYGFSAMGATLGILVLLRLHGEAEGSHLAVLGLLAFPISIGWAVVRYRLLDPPPWLPRLLLFGMTGSVAIALVLGSLLATLGSPDGWTRWNPGGSLAVAILAILSYQAIHLVLHRALRRRVLPTTDSETLAARAIERLQGARSRDAVFAQIEELIREGIGASQVAWIGPDATDDRALPPLVRRGMALWRRAGSPPHRLVLAGPRSEDPGPDQPEIVASLRPPSGPVALLVIASRLDGLPFLPEQIHAVETVGHVARIALGSAASTLELERLVSAKTHSLQRALQDRDRVLETTRVICEADAPEEVVAATQGFALDCTEAAGGDGAPNAEGDGGCAVVAPLMVGPGEERSIRVVTPDSNRASEIQPQLDTVCLFGTLALARLQLLHELKSEVERQAGEIAEVRSRRVHAEFVRNVAHELRKPTQEMATLCEDFHVEGPPTDPRVARLRAVSGELARRLDLLLFHSGLRVERRRIDLTILIDETVRSFGAIIPDRRYLVRHSARPAPLVGDASRLASVLENLIDNAAKATKPGGRVNVRSWLELPDPGSGSQGVACFEVEDDGQGIPPYRQGRIFEAGVCFRGGGFGLGLTLSREIVRRHGGALSVESEPGCTVFRVRLPQFASGLDEGRWS